MEKRWIVAPEVPQEVRMALGYLPPIVGQLLFNRGIATKEAATEYLVPDYARQLHDPFLFTAMERAVERILRAIKNQELIIVFGDYDADGVTGATILSTMLTMLNARHEVYLPHREKEGYGLNAVALQKLIEKKAKLIITCDLGISNAREVAIANAAGVDVIITDHHHIPPEVPQAYAIIHPKLPGNGYPFPHLTGGTVAWKLVSALLVRYREWEHRTVEVIEGYEKWLLDLVAMSTIADVGLLSGENRMLVRYGITVLNKTRRLGLRKLYDIAKVVPGLIDTTTIGFQITPRINAASRMDHANTAFKLLMAATDEEATALAMQLQEKNEERKKATERVTREAIGMVGPSINSGQGNQVVVCAFEPSWPHGVLGIAASRLVEEYGRAAIVACRTSEGKVIASARSIDGINIFDALSQVKSYLPKFGGHPKAAGFTLGEEGKWAEFVIALNKAAATQVLGRELVPEIRLDATIGAHEVTSELWHTITQMEPFGEGNPRPKFLLKNAIIVGKERLGEGGKHLKLTVRSDSDRAPKKIIAFSKGGSWGETFALGDIIDAPVELSANTWNNVTTIEMRALDMRHARVLE